MNNETKADRESTEGIKLTKQVLDAWATDPQAPVALYLKQKLAPVEVESNVIFPPTYADIGYNIDVLSDGTRVATIDSVGSQANRLEPIFKAVPDGQAVNPIADLVPQITIILHSDNSDKKSDESEKPYQEKRSMLDLAHRSADAVVQSCPGLAGAVAKAFRALRQQGDAGPLCALAPTSLLFGVWDSRGETGEKRPRLVRSIIRAWDVETLHAAAQFTSIWKALDPQQQDELKKEAKVKKKDLSTKGLADAPATFRKVGTSAGKYMPEFRDGSPNPERRVLGGVLVKGQIEREVTINLVALRGLRGASPEETDHIRKYLLGLSLIAATSDIELFLREGCHLRYVGKDSWYQVPRRSDPKAIDLSSDDAQALIMNYATDAVAHFKPHWPSTLEYEFDLREAKKLLATKDEEGVEEA
jgi:CRISPR-associated protein Csb1